MQKASIGRVVHVLVDPSKNNGSDVAPALITRVWNEHHQADDVLGVRQIVNVRVLCDSQNTLWCTSIELFDERPHAELLATAKPHDPTGYERVAFWPPRVS